jgi:hypothetical protein
MENVIPTTQKWSNVAKQIEPHDAKKQCRQRNAKKKKKKTTVSKHLFIM